MMKFRLLLVIFLLTNSFSALPLETLPISAYGSLPSISKTKLSPTGKYLSSVRNYDGQLVLTTYEFETKELTPVIQFDNVDVVLNWYEWASDDILLVSAAQPVKARRVGYTITRLYKMDLSKSGKLVMLVKPKDSPGRSENSAQFQDNVISFLPDKPNKILMAIDFDVANYPSLYEVDIKTNRRSRVQRNRKHVVDWIADQQGNPRVAYGRDETEIFYDLYDAKKKRVRRLWSYEVFEDDVVHVMGFDLDPNTLYLKALHEGRYAVFKVDVTDPELNRELVLADPKYDVEGSLVYSPKTRAVIGLNYSNEDDSMVYWDKEYLGLIRGLNKALGGTDNTIISMSNDLNKYVLYTESGDTSGNYFIGDRSNKSLNYFSSRYPEITEQNYAGKELVTYTARDGVIIEGYLTAPINTPEDKELPAIILPHGGPMSRDYGGFDYWSELFANQGYVVFQPNFRGSSGYGHDFEMAAIEGWGKAMQDDLQDAANWLKSKSLVDENRMCIGGASYGGYAAIMAAVKHPDTFKCAASFAGVMDLKRIVDESRRYTNKEIVRKQFGTDKKQLKSTSPINFADQIKIPILLVHGTDDRVVPVIHSQQMARELKSEKKEVKYVELKDGNHNLNIQAHRMITLEEMVSFFDEHLK